MQKIQPMEVDKGATISTCKKYRYALLREWDKKKPCVLFIGLNPSIADDTIDDHTVKKCMGFARRWGFGSMLIGNLFAFRATNPKDMFNTKDPVGVETDLHLQTLSTAVEKVVFCWGADGGFLNRDQELIKAFPDAYCIKKTSKGFPAHPARLGYTDQPIKF